MSFFFHLQWTFFHLAWNFQQTFLEPLVGWNFNYWVTVWELYPSKRLVNEVNHDPCNAVSAIRNFFLEILGLSIYSCSLWWRWTGEADEECEGSERDAGTGGLFPGAPDHDASPKPATRLKEKRMNRCVMLS